MNVDEFLRQTEELADEREGASPHRVYKLLALVRKLREQRDISIGAWAVAKGFKLADSKALVAVDNADLDEIVTHERKTGKPATELQQLRSQLKGKKR